MIPLEFLFSNSLPKLWCPEGVKSSELVPAFLQRGVIIAGGLGTRKGTRSLSSCHHTDLTLAVLSYRFILPHRVCLHARFIILCSYFVDRHMGITAVKHDRGDVDQILSVLKDVLAEAAGKKA